jgi:hypothetical protein
MIESRDVTRSLHTAREIFSPTSEQHERVRAALRARLALEAESEARGTAGAARAAVRRGRVLTLAKSGALIGIGFALGYWFAEIRADGEDVSSAASRAVEERAGAATMLLDSARSLDGGLLLDGGRGPRGMPPTESSRAAPTASVASGAAAPRRRPRAHPAREPQRTAPASTSEELILLQRAERAIRAADGALARSFIAELDARFPKTTWREERSAILVLAACALEEPSAESDAREFLRRHTASVYFDRIQMFCRQGATPSANGMTPRETGGPSSDTHRAEENP